MCDMWQVLKGRVTAGNFSLSAGDISLQSAAGVFFLPACDKMGDTGENSRHTTSSLGKLSHSIQGTHMSLFPEGVSWFCLAILNPRDKSARLRIFSLKTNISHKNFSTKLSFQSYRWFSSQTEPWSHLWIQHRTILRNPTLPPDLLSGQT